MTPQTPDDWADLYRGLDAAIERYLSDLVYEGGKKTFLLDLVAAVETLREQARTPS